MAVKRMVKLSWKEFCSFPIDDHCTLLCLRVHDYIVLGEIIVAKSLVAGVVVVLLVHQRVDTRAGGITSLVGPPIVVLLRAWRFANILST